jgi:hypothetical protein
MNRINATTHRALISEAQAFRRLIGGDYGGEVTGLLYHLGACIKRLNTAEVERCNKGGSDALNAKIDRCLTRIRAQVEALNAFIKPRTDKDGLKVEFSGLSARIYTEAGDFREVFYYLLGCE